jgi:ADP-ribose pyrophosphatase YjhB (NUDIX family)
MLTEIVASVMRSLLTALIIEGQAADENLVQASAGRRSQRERQEVNQKVRATVVLIEERQILLVQQRVSASLERRWSLPGGTLELGETLEDCAIRETKEETGLHVSVDRLLYVCDRIQDGNHVVHITFAVRRIGGRLEVGAEPEPEANPITDVRMVPLESLCELGFTERFRDLAMQDFPDSGTYQGLVQNIGL